MPKDSSKAAKPSKEATKEKSKKPAKADETASPKAPKSSDNRPVYKMKDVKVKNIVFSDVKKGGQQPIAFVNYNVNNTDTHLMFQSGFIEFTSHGIPRISDDSKYYKTDADREFIKILLDDKQPACAELREFLLRLDEYMRTDEVKLKLSGGKKKKANQLVYQSLVKTPPPKDDDDDDEDEKPKKGKGKKGKDEGEKKEYPIVDYCKAKYNFTGEDENHKCITNFYKCESVDSKGEWEKKEYTTMTDVNDALGYGHKSRFVIYVNKCWINGSEIAGTGATKEGSKYLYGLGLKVITQQYVAGKKGGANFKDVKFLDQDDGEEPKGKKTTKAPKMDSDDEDEAPKDKKKTPKAAESEDEDEEDEEKPTKGSGDSDVEEDDEDEKPAKNKKTPKKEESDEEEEDEDEKPAKNKKTPKKEESDEEEEDEDEKPAKGKKAPKKDTKPKGKAPKKDESDEEDEDDDTPVVKKPKGKAAAAGKKPKGK